jgi:iron complex outermembrane receptor protein
MSELINKNDNRSTIHWKLLTGASALALTAYVTSTAVANAEDASQPQIWIELGGQLSRLNDGQEIFTPAFPNSPSRPSIFSPSQKFETSPLYSIDEEGKLSFQPENSDWVFSAAIRYGRSASNNHVSQQTSPKTFHFQRHYYGKTFSYSNIPVAERFADTQSSTSERHLILDFEAGKDVGLGMFGLKYGSSVLNIGVRFAQFRSRTNIALKSDPDFHFSYKYNPSLLYFGFTNSKLPSRDPYHINSASLRATRTFRGVGPSISWSASAPFAGNPQDGELGFDWDVNAALLFGRQQTKVQHQTTGRYHHGSFNPYPTRPITYHPAPVDKTRSRNITVPNVGGSVGLTWRVQDFKMSFGYRADFFFGAIDGGIDTRKNENRAFNGPYASISVGLGD